MNDLSGKVAVVTGAASGIGLAMAQRFAVEGMRVVLADIEPGPLAAEASRLSEQGHEVSSFEVDVAQADKVQELADFTLATYGAVHLLCNNAGVGLGGTLWEHSAEDWDWLIGVNVLGVANGLRAFVPRMLEQGGACHIVNTASAAGLDARPWLGVYSATKYAVVAISEALRSEFQMRGSQIGVSVLCPAVVNTRIADSERNRSLRSTVASAELTPEASAFDQAFRTALAGGLPPEQIADSVVAAIRSDRFYIITHAETEARVRSRFGQILNDAALPVG
jgi:NADP-dependent 3-hydroxy acid dehydrogenase YdfG